MKYLEFFGWGIVTYAVVRLIAEGFSILTFSSGLLPHILLLVVLLCVSIVAGRSLKFSSVLDILPYSVFWFLEILILDWFYSVPTVTYSMYSDWKLWFGYSLVVIIPLLAPFTRMNKRTVSSQT